MFADPVKHTSSAYKNYPHAALNRDCWMGRGGGGGGGGAMYLSIECMYIIHADCILFGGLFQFSYLKH